MIVIVRAKVRHKIGTSVGIQLLFVGNPLSCIGKSPTLQKLRLIRMRMIIQPLLRVDRQQRKKWPRIKLSNITQLLN